ncbi:MAG: anti-sigma factor [Gammaproteobacteria bacterium]
MNASNVRDNDRLAELLADEASAALEAGDLPELNGLLDRTASAHRDDFMRAAALAQVAFLQQARRPASGQPSASRMPPGLKERIASQGEAAVLRQRGPSAVRRPAPAVSTPSPVRTIGTATQASGAGRPRPSTGRNSPAGYAGWALAAMLAVALVVVRNEGPSAPGSAAARASLVDEATDVVTLPWAVPTAEGYRGVTGDVVWSQSKQQGYLRLANMPVNDPARVQYQLWIVDPDRDKHPVDGGVFNVSSTGEVIIPIQAKLPIRSPKAFAITAEQPGGVVVSAGPLLVVAAS